MFILTVSYTFSVLLFSSCLRACFCCLSLYLAHAYPTAPTVLIETPVSVNGVATTPPKVKNPTAVVIMLFTIPTRLKAKKYYY